MKLNVMVRKMGIIRQGIREYGNKGVCPAWVGFRYIAQEIIYVRLEAVPALLGAVH